MGSKSAQNEARVSARRHKRNVSTHSQVKTDIAGAEKLLFTGDVAGGKEAVKKAISALDKAGGKKILHANNAARRKSRLQKKLNKALAGPSAPKAA